MSWRSTGRWSLLFPWIALGTLAAQAHETASIRVGPSVLVSGAFRSANHNETVVAAHPSDANVLVACAMVDLAAGRRSGVAAYRSTDGGQSWELGWRAPHHFAGDPSCVFDGDGTAWLAFKTNTGTPAPDSWGSDTDSLTFVASTDRGGTWSAPRQIAQANDRPFIVADTTHGARRGTVYSVYDGHAHTRPLSHANTDFRHELVLAASPRGRAITQETRRLLPIQTPSLSHSSLACGIVALSTGTVIVLQHHMRLAPSVPGAGKLSEVGGTLDVFASSDGGRTLDSIASFGEITSVYNAAPSRGITGALAADPGSARFRDRLYALWTDFRSGRGVLTLRISSDGGRIWKAPAAVLPSGTASRFMPTIAVNRDGVVGVLWYERLPGTSDGYQPMFSASRDGGASWLGAVALTSAINTRRQQRGSSTGAFLPNGGDTAGLVADINGRFHAVWIDNRTGAQQAWSTTVDVAPR